MQRFYDFETILREVSSALEEIAQRNNLELHHPVTLCAILEAIASPLKAQKLHGSPLMQKVGLRAIEAYLASLAARKVELLKSPHSLRVNPMMDAVVMALLKKGTVPKDRLFREALKVHLPLSGRAKGEIDAAVEKHEYLEASLASALAYLQEGEVVRPSEDGTGWELTF
jgi:hypothetical protein